MDNTTITLVISAVTALGTVVAVFIYSETLKENKRQRLEKYIPYLFIDRASFFVQGIPYEDFAVPRIWTDEALKFEDFYTAMDDGTSSRYYLKLYNLGFGIAKNVEVIYYYDIEDFVKRIIEIGLKVPEDMRVEITLTTNRISFSSKIKKLPFFNSSIPRDYKMENSFDYLIPITISDKHYLLDLPLSFMELFNVYMFYVGYQLGREPVRINPPIVTITATYENIANKECKQSFTLTVDLNRPFGGGTYGGQLIIAEGI